MATRPYRSEVRQAGADQTRKRIVDAAAGLLGAPDGHTAFSMEAVAKRAGVTRVTIYHQFETKRRLLDAVFDDIAVRGGLNALPQVFSQSDARAALRSVVTIFCRFWTSHRTLMPRLTAAFEDAEVSDSVKARAERRRHGLAVLVGRLSGGQAKGAGLDLTDVLFALTSFEMFDLLSAPDRNAKAVEALIQALVEAAVERFTSPSRGAAA